MFNNVTAIKKQALKVFLLTQSSSYTELIYAHIPINQILDEFHKFNPQARGKL